MLRKCLSIISIMAFVTVNSVPAAAVGPEPVVGAQYNAFDGRHRSTELTARAYIRIPFSGGFRNSVSGTRLGLSVGARLPAQDRHKGRFALAGAAKFVDLSIGLHGKESFRFNGMTMAEMEGLRADDDGEGKKTRVWPWVLGGGVILIVVATIAINSAAKDAGAAVGSALCQASGANCDDN